MVLLLIEFAPANFQHYLRTGDGDRAVSGRTITFRCDIYCRIIGGWGKVPFNLFRFSRLSFLDRPFSFGSRMSPKLSLIPIRL